MVVEILALEMLLGKPGCDLQLTIAILGGSINRLQYSGAKTRLREMGSGIYTAVLVLGFSCSSDGNPNSRL